MAGTAHTLTDSTELEAELTSKRERGYAVDDAERRHGIRRLGVPIMNERDGVIGSIGIAGPKARLDPAFLNRLYGILSEKRNIIEVRKNFYQ